MDRSSIPIAVVGFAFEFPQDAVSEEKFWDMIQSGRSAISEFPKDRINIDAFYHPDTSRISTLPVQHGHFIKEDLSAFDAPFFGISPDEAACLDPQQRRMLETTYHALENAGISMAKCCGSDAAVYTASFTNDYLNVIGRDHEMQQTHAALGVTNGMIASRLSWFFDLKGTSMNIDTACSSSMVALHLACQELRTTSTSMALVGGSGLHFHPDFWQMLSNGKFLSPDGQSRSFDSRANGYARGEGIAVLVVKRLSDAIRDNDTIRAVIRQTGVNQDGKTAGITQPSEEAQLALIKDTFAKAGLSMDPTRFFEAHGTGTSLGDPLEARAISKAFRNIRSSSEPLFVGAVKANIGHLEGASGLAGIIKTIMVLEKGIIPPIAGLQTLNPKVAAESTCLNFPKNALLWPAHGLRRACVNSFGYGGTNSLAIIDDAYHYLKMHDLCGHHRTNIHPEPGQGTQSSKYLNRQALQRCSFDSSSEQWATSNLQLLVWSAFDEESATVVGTKFKDFVTSRPDELANLAYFLAERRSSHRWRAFTVIGARSGTPVPPVMSSVPVRARGNNSIAYVFTGQGAHYRGMGHGLGIFPAYKNTLQVLDQELASLGCPWSLQDAMEPSSHDTASSSARYSQVLTTCLQIALVDLLRSLGILPSVVVGHSSGEIAAAYAIGAISRLAALKIAHWRGVLAAEVESVQDQSMMAVGLSRTEIEIYLERLRQSCGCLSLSIGCINSPRNITLTGKRSQMLELQKLLQQDSVFTRMLQVSVAYHSNFMNEIAADYLAALDRLEGSVLAKGAIMVSSVTGEIIVPEHLRSAQYWVKNLTSKVEFEAALSTVLSFGASSTKTLTKKSSTRNVTHFMEIGPHSTLKSSIRDNVQAASPVAKPRYVQMLSRTSNAHHSVLTAVGQLFCDGIQVDVQAANDPTRQSRPIPQGLPKYPFRHSASYWKESRISRNFRLRTTARHELLGTRSLDWNPEVAQWRNVIRLSEVPWLADHTVNGRPVLPAAAIVTMAIEAVKQIVVDQQDFVGVRIRDAAFIRPMHFSELEQSFEAQVNLSTTSLTNTNGKWFKYRIFTAVQDQYLECSTGFIQLVRAKKVSSNIIDGASFLEAGNAKTWADHLSIHCQSAPTDPYELLRKYAIQYGPSFRCVESMRLCDSTDCHAATATIRPALQSLGPTHLASQSCEVHPTIFDGLAQLIAPTFAENRTERTPALLPSRISRIYIDRRHKTCLESSTIDAYAHCRLKGRKGVVANILAMQKGSKEPFLCLEGVELARIEDREASTQDTSSVQKDLYMQQIWKPDIDMMDKQQLRQFCTKDKPQGSKKTHAADAYLELVIGVFIRRAVKLLDEDPSISPQTHLQYYVRWLRYQYDRLGQLPSSDCIKTLHDSSCGTLGDEDIIRRVADSNAKGQYIVRIGQNLENMLRGYSDPLKFVFQDELIDRFYAEMMADERHLHSLAAYLELLSFKRPTLKILEIGAGTGGQTLRLLQILSSSGTTRCAQYDYTDISPSFFERVRDKLKAFSKILRFQTCDISQDPTIQGFVPASYDIVFAGHVIHATNSIATALDNIRLLLKPSGKLILMEPTIPEALTTGFTGGLLEGWWSPLQHESRSFLSPCLTTPGWHKQLQLSGFSGVDLDLTGDDRLESLYGSILLSSIQPMRTQDGHEYPSMAVVIDSENGSQRCLADVLMEQRPHSSQHTLVTIKTTELPASTTIIFLLDVDQTFLDGISVCQYRDLQSVLLRFKTTVWVTRSTLKQLKPYHQIAAGLGHTLSSEDTVRKFVTLNLQDEQRDCSESIRMILRMTRQLKASSVDELETNYISTPDGLHISRICRDDEMSQKIVTASIVTTRRQIQLHSDNCIRLYPPSLTDPDGLQFRESCQLHLPPAHDEVFVQIKAQGLSHRDVLLHSGQLDSKEPITEISGVITAAGSASGYAVGDRVCSIINDYGRSRICLKASKVAMIPESMDYTDAATLPLAAWMSYYTLIHVGRLQTGDSVLIHKANSTIGQVLIQVATKLKLRILLTMNSLAKRNGFCDRAGIDKSSVFDSSDPLLASRILQATAHQGVDLVVGCMKSDAGAGLTECVTVMGRAVDMELTSSSKMASVKFRDSNKSISRLDIDIAEVFVRKPDVSYAVLVKAMRMVFDWNIDIPQPLHVFEANDINAALTHLQNSHFIGKRVIRYGSKSVTVQMRPPPSSIFSANATYVVAGGFGGLGRCITSWMVEQGARFLVLLSRSGPTSNASKTLLEELRRRGVTCVASEVDISNSQQVKQILKDVSSMLPPIKGCIQAASALKDNIFENMSHDDWSTSVNAKVSGSWNLHENLPSDLDFFVLLSSLGGIIGSPGQANYVAGCNFQDALVRYRLSQGLKAVSINLGVMAQDGVVAESDFLRTFNRRYGIFVDITTEKLLSLLGYYCNRDRSILDVSEGQVITGIELPSNIIAKGYDVPQFLRRPMFSHLFCIDTDDRGNVHQPECVPDYNDAVNGSSQEQRQLDWQAILSNATSVTEANDIVTSWLILKLSLLLSQPQAEFDADQPIHRYGIDSLVAIDLKNWFRTNLKVDIDVLELMAGSSLKSLGEIAVQKRCKAGEFRGLAD